MPRELGRNLIKRDPVCHHAWPILAKQGGVIKDVAMRWAKGQMPFSKMKAELEDRILNIELILHDAQTAYEEGKNVASAPEPRTCDEGVPEIHSGLQEEVRNGAESGSLP